MYNMSTLIIRQVGRRTHLMYISSLPCVSDPAVYIRAAILITWLPTSVHRLSSQYLLHPNTLNIKYLLSKVLNLIANVYEICLNKIYLFIIRRFINSEPTKLIMDNLLIYLLCGMKFFQS
uniref:G_PROTEIN_RECEP_F1_2 domain-containing protein n=1 Tax=Heterorhabditis bacteriophora TaxID=37862 RepID=A0A1I7WW82_HETBA